MEILAEKRISGYNEKMNKAGYEYLLAYKLTVPIYGYTVEFCKRWVDLKSGTKDQMEQAARSVSSLKEKHMREGGLSEKLYQARKKFRGY